MLQFKNFQIENPVSIAVDDMTLEPGRVYGLAGASGSGKSTILKAIAGFGEKVEGELLWEERSIGDERPENRPVSMLFQHQNLFMHLTLRENMALGLNIGAHSALSDLARKRVEVLARQLRIEDELDKLPRACSGGQCARAALGRVILDERRIILLDEAFHSLGPAQREEIRNLIEANLVAHNRIVIFSSHQTGELFDWSQEILWLDGTRLNSPQKTKHFFVNAPESAKYYFGSDFEQFI